MFTKVLNKVSLYIKNINENKEPKRKFTVEDIFDKNGESWVLIRVVGTKQVFKKSPNDILADDDFTNSFSQLDVRTLTYLGYSNMNDSKYKIIAEKYNSNGELQYFVNKKGSKSINVYSHEDMIQPEIRDNLSKSDIFRLGIETHNQEIITIQKDLLPNKAK